MHILVFDSGLGGLTVHSEIRKLLPGVRYTYLADDAVFPYGRLSESALVDRVMEIVGHVIDRDRPDIVVIACNTASTLVLPHLRAKYAMPFVGTVPAIKPAALVSKSRMISVLATPGTVARDYTRSLINEFAAGCEVTLVGCELLASIAEKKLRGIRICDAEIRPELGRAFVEHGLERTDSIVLACTHYPLLLDDFVRLAQWPVIWIDPAPAIARRVAHLAGRLEIDERAAAMPGRAVFTSGSNPGEVLMQALQSRGLVAS